MSRFGDLQDLVEHVRSAASELESSPPPYAPLVDDDYLKLLALDQRPLCHDAPLDPAAPRLAELLAYDRDDGDFLRGAYRQLLGRECDDEGYHYYLDLVRGEGRLAVLVTLARAEEAIHFRHAHRRQLPDRLVSCMRAWQRLSSLGPLRGLGERAWRRYLAWLTRRHRQDWALEAGLCRLLAEQRAWRGDRHGLVSALLEMNRQQGCLSERQEQEHARQQALWTQLATIRRQAVSSSPEAPPPPSGGESLPILDSATLDAYYIAFEAAFRGPEAQIAEHLDHYRGDWTRARQVGQQALDLGCGRGEWLRLLTQAGFEARGIDLNASMVAHCREQGFAVTRQDALAALADCADDSLALISGFHIAEHLPFDTLFALVQQAQRALAPGGVLILETPNPENLIVASYSFYHDPTHRNPLTPVTLQFLLQFHGFGDTAIRRFNAPPEATRLPGDGPVVERLNAMLAAPMDYAVVGTKAPREEAQG
ncbi:methyltransferase domain-containing protein [Halomonas pacifica]|uniref:methyltransferase domain-containing protein n=1 Tax=Bisbaumannia pacifica TaxID=77098 RepID=UPI0023580DC5|nr:methyltransferase domain-containing protein [Halomonas pacifica]MDC8803664.1 methyltransferase domain-containing protein [Halomonas pacifica]